MTSPSSCRSSKYRAYLRPAQPPGCTAMRREYSLSSCSGLPEVSRSRSSATFDAADWVTIIASVVIDTAILLPRVLPESYLTSVHYQPFRGKNYPCQGDRADQEGSGPGQARGRRLGDQGGQEQEGRSGGTEQRRSKHKDVPELVAPHRDTLVRGGGCEAELTDPQAGRHVGPERAVIGGQRFGIVTDPSYRGQRVEDRLREAKVADRLSDLPLLYQPRPVTRHAGEERSGAVEDVDVMESRHEQPPVDARDQLLPGDRPAVHDHVARPRPVLVRARVVAARGEAEAPSGPQIGYRLLRDPTIYDLDPPFGEALEIEPDAHRQRVIHVVGDGHVGNRDLLAPPLAQEALPVDHLLGSEPGVREVLEEQRHRVRLQHDLVLARTDVDGPLSRPRFLHRGSGQCSIVDVVDLMGGELSIAGRITEVGETTGHTPRVRIEAIDALGRHDAVDVGTRLEDSGGLAAFDDPQHLADGTRPSLGRAGRGDVIESHDSLGAPHLGRVRETWEVGIVGRCVCCFEGRLRGPLEMLWLQLVRRGGRVALTHGSAHVGPDRPLNRVLDDLGARVAGECGVRGGEEDLDSVRAGEIEYLLRDAPQPIGFCGKPRHWLTPTETFLNRAGAVPWPTRIVCPGCPLPQLGVPHIFHASDPAIASHEPQN